MESIFSLPRVYNTSRSSRATREDRLKVSDNFGGQPPHRCEPCVVFNHKGCHGSLKGIPCNCECDPAFNSRRASGKPEEVTEQGWREANAR